MEQLKKDLIYLMYCAANEQTPDKAKVAAMDLDKLYDTAKKHRICSVLYVPLEAAGAADERFSQAYNKSVRKNRHLVSPHEGLYPQGSLSLSGNA